MLLSDYVSQVTDPGSGLSQQQRLQVVLDAENLLRSHLLTVLRVPQTELPQVAQGDREAMLPAPYDRLYLYALEAAICYALGENTRYNNAVTLYRALLQRLDLAVMHLHSPQNDTVLRLV